MNLKKYGMLALFAGALTFSFPSFGGDGINSGRTITTRDILGEKTITDIDGDGTLDRIFLTRGSTSMPYSIIHEAGNSKNYNGPVEDYLKGFKRYLCSRYDGRDKCSYINSYDATKDQKIFEESR